MDHQEMASGSWTGLMWLRIGTGGGFNRFIIQLMRTT